MAGFLLRAGVVALVAVLAVLSLILQRTWKAVGYGRVLQPIGDFPYTCRRIHEPRLKACEDMWLSEATRQLFLACGDPIARSHWSLVVHKLDWERRSKLDAIIALDLDRPKADGSFVHRVLPLSGFTGADQGRIYMNGISGADGTGKDGKPKVTIALTNYGPSVDPVTGAVLDQKKNGANATIEVFETGPDAAELRHVRTFADPSITMPNRPSLAGEDVNDGFYVTNESKEKVGLLAIFMQLGSVAFGDGSGCREVVSNIRFPNGIHRAKNGLVYVPTNGDMAISVLMKGEDQTGLREVALLDLDGYSPDNISEDANGNLYVATSPKPLDALSITSDPLNSWPRSAVFRIRTSPAAGGKTAPAAITLIAEKIIEDRDGDVLPGSTTAVHDAKTGRLFLSALILLPHMG